MKAQRAPYTTGDRVSVLHSCQGQGTVLATLTVNRVVPLNTRGSWRLEMTRGDGTPLHVVVDASGRDRNGYVERVTA